MFKFRWADKTTAIRANVQYDTSTTALWLLSIPVPESLWGRPVTSAFDY